MISRWERRTATRKQTWAGLTSPPGDAVQVSMSVDGAPLGAAVTTYWFGPDDQPLGYETKTVEAGQQELRFMHENTHDWRGGDYRAEIWVGDEKVNEQEFEISVSAG
jgi:hypothetical protein